jgi:L-ascorbate metabolism protein UlaG (beta-lactamase superfamily)
MTIQWYGHACFKITTRWTPPGSPQSEEIVFVIDPFDKKIGLRPPGGKADVVLVTHDHDDHNNAGALSGDPLVISGPGEYDVKGVFIKGLGAYHDMKEGRERGRVTMYVLEMEDLKICHLGDFGQEELTEEQLAQIGDIDILMVPVGGVYTIDAEGAQKIANQIEPAIIIPMHYHVPGLSVKLEKVEEFLKAMGVKDPETLARVTLKKKDINPEETKIVVMQMA